MNKSYLYLFIAGIILMFVFTFRLYGGQTVVFAEDSVEDQLEELEDKIEELEDKDSEVKGELSEIEKKADEISTRISQLSGNLSVTQSELNSLKVQIQELAEDIDNMNNKMIIKNRELEDQRLIRNATLKGLYISGQTPEFQLFLSEDSLASFIQSSAYKTRFIDDSKMLIGSISHKIKQYEDDVKTIEDIKLQVEKQKKDLETLATKLASQVAGAKNDLASASQKKNSLEQERAEISKKLSELSQKQKSLLAEKTETFSTSVGDVPTTGDPNARADYDPGFRKAFAMFSFGAPHRKGMSQYGAKGRAESGQSYKDILKAYYGDIEIIDADLPSNLNTSSGSMELDGKYLNGLAEMPSSWPKEALKSQAIAARTYAMSYVGWRTSNTNPGGSICTTESCQVWSSSKASSSSAANWHDAVSDTKGKIMISKKTGKIFSSWYAASSGGYNYSYNSLGHPTSGGWDTKCKSKDCWTSDAYESIGSSPWFYKGWYKSRSGKTCGRSHPWLTEEEYADIIGAMVLIQEDSDNQTHLSQPDAQSCWGEDIPDTWSRAKVKEKSGITDISDVDVSYSSGGVTASVKVKTNKGEYTFNGDDYKAMFNLRAPGVIHLKSLLFNVEMKD